MPVYLLHGFKWPRKSIRIHIILQNLDDAAAEWLVAPATTSALLENFREIYSECMEHLPNLRFVEQYDPDDTSPGVGSQPHAYVADVCEEIRLGVDVDEVRGRGVHNDQWASMMELRDKLAKDQKVAWYVVVCGDEERWAPGQSTSSASIPQDQEGSSDASQNDSEEAYEHDSIGGEDAVPDPKPTTLLELQQQQATQPKGLKKFFSTLTKQRSRSKLANKQSVDTMNTAIRDQPILGNQKYEPSVTDSSNSSTDKARISSPEEIPHVPIQKTSLPKLQTQDLTSQSSHRPLVAPVSALTQSPGGLSLIPSDDDEDHEIITGPSYDDNDDDLAAPAPTVKHGKQQDLVQRQRKRSSISSFRSATRATSPETLRTIGPLVRQRPDGSFGSTTSLSSLNHTSHAYNADDIIPTKLQLELMRDDIEEEPARPTRNNPSPPASYRPTGAPAGGASLSTSRSTSPVKLPSSRRRSSSRLAALAALEGDTPLGSSPPRRSGRGGRDGRSRRSSAALNARASQYSMSSMSNAMASLYGAHERDFNRHRQSVTQDDLVARGLENMDFTALR